jgi:heptosyltransferase III
MQRTLFVLHPGSLGDVLLALPALRALRAAFPGRALGLMAQEEIGRLLLTGAEVDKTFSLEGPWPADILAGTRAAGAAMHQWLLRCDVAVAWMADTDHHLGSALRTFSITHVIVASPHSPGYRSVHQTDRFLETVSSLAPMRVHGTSLQVPRDIVCDATSRLSSIGMSPSHELVIIHPGSGSRHKCASPKLFAHFLGRLKTDGIFPLVVGGPADVDAILDLQRICPEPFQVLQDLDLVSMAGVIAHADCFIGHDSGLTHLAACLQVPTIALFGPTDPQRWAPRGPHVKVVTGASCRCQGLGWETVHACREKPCLQITLDSIMSARIAFCGDGIQRAS